ncbi:MAG: hypothetical protein LC679_09080 [Intrasporangiaceae bacterium]|nr:hypothetical protein [Intrasporangiaceae bacterium]
MSSDNAWSTSGVGDGHRAGASGVGGGHRIGTSGVGDGRPIGTSGVGDVIRSTGGVICSVAGVIRSTGGVIRSTGGVIRNLFEFSLACFRHGVFQQGAGGFAEQHPIPGDDHAVLLVHDHFRSVVRDLDAEHLRVVCQPIDRIRGVSGRHRPGQRCRHRTRTDLVGIQRDTEAFPQGRGDGPGHRLRVLVIRQADPQPAPPGFLDRRDVGFRDPGNGLDGPFKVRVGRCRPCHRSILGLDHAVSPHRSPVRGSHPYPCPVVAVLSPASTAAVTAGAVNEVVEQARVGPVSLRKRRRCRRSADADVDRS